jgi:hypothetical protein
MKCITVALDVGFEDVLIKTLKNLRIESYIKLPVVHGVVDKLEPLMGSHIFPGHMVMYMVYVDEVEFPSVKDGLVQMKRRLTGKSCIICAHDIQLIE